MPPMLGHTATESPLHRSTQHAFRHPLGMRTGSHRCSHVLLDSQGQGSAICPIPELVGACLAFIQISQLSVTFQTKGRMKVGTGGQETKGAVAERGFPGLGQSELQAGMASEARGSLPGIVLSIPHLARPCPACPKNGGAGCRNCSWEDHSHTWLSKGPPSLAQMPPPP